MREAAAFSRRAKISESVRPGRVQGSFLKLKGWDWDVLVRGGGSGGGKGAYDLEGALGGLGGFGSAESNV